MIEKRVPREVVNFINSFYFIFKMLVFLKYYLLFGCRGNLTTKEKSDDTFHSVALKGRKAQISCWRC